LLIIFIPQKKNFQPLFLRLKIAFAVIGKKESVAQEVVEKWKDGK